MTTPPDRAALREQLTEAEQESPGEWKAVVVPRHVLAALLDALDAAEAEMVQLRNDAVVVREGHWEETLAELRAAEAERDRFKADYIHACELVARMHAAAVGEVRGPIVGVVEDVEALRAERDGLREEAAACYRHPAVVEPELPDYDLLQKFADGQGGRRTGDLMRRGWIHVWVTELGLKVLAGRTDRALRPAGTGDAP